MEWVLVEFVCVLNKTESFQSTIFLIYNFMWKCSEVYRYIGNVFNCSWYGKWLLESGGRRRDTRNNEILQSIWKSTVESDAYEGFKHSSNLCINYDEYTKGMIHIIKG